MNDLWITDPPYSDAVNYHELSEFFISWFGGRIAKNFSDWSECSQRNLAIKGNDLAFFALMKNSYLNLINNMPENGMQTVMFTHQDASAWANLTLILWAAGLSVQSAWCVATETDSGLKSGNYVKGTVLLNLKKNTSKDTAFLDELYPQVEDEVKKQLTLMMSIDDQDDPNFGDTDLQLAAYAAALRVLTQYASIEDFDIEHELSKGQNENTSSPIVKIIETAVKIATEYLIPKGFNTRHWRNLSSEERFYLKGLEIESTGDCRNSVYQELAKGYGIKQYTFMLATEKANKTRLKTPVEFARRDLETEGFGKTLTRQVLFAIYESKRSQGTQHGKNWLKNEVPDYWNQRQLIIALLEYLILFKNKLEHWKEEGDLAMLLMGAIKNDHV